MKRQFIFCFLASLLLTTIALSPDRANGQIRDWNDGSGTWSDASKWNPNLIPSFTDLVCIGILPAASDADVELDVNTAILGLQIYDGMSLQTNNHNLQVIFDTLITGVHDAVLSTVLAVGR